jgi:hypothetical protein
MRYEKQTIVTITMTSEELDLLVAEINNLLENSSEIPSILEQFFDIVEY